ncbi:amino acid permease [Planctomycetes bacterium K23_9]|uniref:Putative amino acid permease YhdG n=1 Tax=Stieleria marina TaxID=1930275 RepID=A0A517P3F6_9BACT|nr:putative amino acid permease YhdG [Planctomycetes bacterium K23_9]
MLGSGIFVLPGLAAAKTGPMVWLAYLAAGLCVLPAALSKSELATAMPTSGGTYVYLERTFGPLAGTVSGLGLWLSLLLKSAFALLGFSAYLSVLSPGIPPKPVALALLAAITLLNIMGVSVISKMQKIVVGVVIVALIALALLGLRTMDTELLAGGFAQGTHGFIAAAAFVYVSYAGVTKVAAIAEEVKNPDRNLPLGILISWVSVMSIYVFVVLVLVTNVPTEQLTNYNGTGKPDLHPIYTLTVIIAGKTAGTVAAVLAVLTMVSMAIAGLLAASRFPFAMSRDNLLPQKLREVNQRFMTPVWCILLTSTVMAISILFLPVEQIAKLASAFMILAFMFICGTVFVLREYAGTWYQPRFRAPLYPLTQIVGIVLGLTLLSAMGLTSLAAIAGIVLLGALSYAFYGRKYASQRGVFGKMGKRRELLGDNEAAIAQTLGEQLPAEAAVVVPLFGNERSAETLVEMGAALAHGRKLEVLHVTPVPEQMYMADALADDNQSNALRRRIHTMADEEDVQLEYDTTATRDVVHTIHDVANRLHCEWVVMESSHKRHRGITFQNPLGWLQDHLPCNLAVFKDAGVRYIRQILVWAEPGPHDSLVVATADHLAKIYGAELNFVCFIQDNEEAHSSQARADYVGQLIDMCEAPSKAVMLHGTDELAAIEKATQDDDLLIMGAPPDRSFIGRWFGTPKDKLTRDASCSVLWLKTPRTQTHESFDVSNITVEREFHLFDHLPADNFHLQLKTSKKEELFRMAADYFAKQYGDDISPIIISTALWEREQLQNTSVGKGVAMPHATLARAPAGKSCVAIFSTEKPIDYGAPDKQKCDIFFFTIGPSSDRTIHLKILAEISKLSLKTTLLGDIRAAKTSEEATAATHRCLDQIHGV